MDVGWLLCNVRPILLKVNTGSIHCLQVTSTSEPYLKSCLLFSFFYLHFFGLTSTYHLAQNVNFLKNYATKFKNSKTTINFNDFSMIINWFKQHSPGSHFYEFSWWYTLLNLHSTTQAHSPFPSPSPLPHTYTNGLATQKDIFKCAKSS